MKIRGDIKNGTPAAIARRLLEYAKACERTAARSPKYAYRLRAEGRADAYYTAVQMIIRHMRPKKKTGRKTKS